MSVDGLSSTAPVKIPGISYRSTSPMIRLGTCEQDNNIDNIVALSDSNY